MASLLFMGVGYLVLGGGYSILSRGGTPLVWEGFIDSLPFAKAAAIALLPHVTMLLVSVALLGTQVISQIPATLLVFIKGGWDYDLAQNTIDAGLSIFKENPFKGYLITMLAVSISSLLPVPIMGGGFFYRFILSEKNHGILTTAFGVALFGFYITYLLIWIF